MKVAQLTIEMAANVARLQKDMAQAQRSVESTMGRIRQSADSAMRALGAIGIGLSVGAFANWIKGAIDAIDRLNDISAATGITVTKLAGLDYAAKLSGTSLDSVTQASNKLQLSLVTNNAALSKVGITAQDPVEALAQLADAYAATEGQSNKAALGNLALGKSWQSIAGVLAQGGDGLRRLIAEGEALSGVTEETARDAGKFNDEIDKLTTRLGALALNIAGPVLKVFSEFIDELNEGTKAAGGFWKAIGMFGTTNPFLSLEENVAKYRKEVEELTEKQQKYGELASLAFGVNEKLATATQRLAYFEAMLAIEKRKSAAAMAEGASGANAHVIAYNAMTSSADDLLEQMKQEFLLIGLTNEERAVSIAMRKLEELGMRQGTDVFEKYMKEVMEIQKRIGVKREMVRLSEEAAKNAKREAEEYDRLVKSFQEQIAKMQIENETYFAGNAARERAIFLRETENLKIEDRSRLLEQYDEAAAIKKANEARKKGVEQQIKQQEEFAQKMEKINDQIGQSLTDALMNGGMNARDFIVNMFKTMILRPVLQPIIGAVTGAVTSLFAGSALAGGTGAAASGASSMSQAGSLLGIVGAAKTAYQVVTNGFASIGTAASNLAATFMGQNLAINAALIEGGTIGTAGAALEANALATSQLASSVGIFAQYAAGIGAGVMAGQMISGKYKVGGSSYLTTGAGAIIGAIVGGPIGAAIGGAIGGVINRAFGMAPKETSSAGFDLTLAASGAITTGFEKWEQKGGWFRSSRSGKEITAVAQDTIDFFNNSAMAVSASVAGMSKMFGASLDNINNFKLDIVIETLNATKEQIEEQIGGAFKYMETSLVEFLIPSIYEFATASDKTASDILKRLVASITTVNQAFEVLGYNLYEVSLQGAAASQKIVDLFGGIENFTKSTSFYYENFYSAQEKVNFQTEQLTKIFGSLGLVLPQTKDQFRALIDLVQAAGDDQLFATLVQLAPAFNTLRTSIDQLATGSESAANTIADAARTMDQIAQERRSIEDRILQLQGNTVELRRRELESLDGSNRALQQMIYDIEDAQKASENARNALNNAAQKEKADAQASHTQELARLRAQFDATSKGIESQKSLLTAAKQNADKTASAMKSFFDFLQSEIDGLLAGVNALVSPQEGMRFISQALQQARTTGALPNEQLLRDAIQAARSGITEESFASSFEFQRASFRLAGDLMSLQEIAQAQMKIAEEQSAMIEPDLRAIERQLDEAESNYNYSVSMAEGQHQQAMDAAQAQIDSINNVDESIMSLSEAILRAMQAEAELERLMKMEIPKTEETGTETTTDENGTIGEENKRLQDIKKLYDDLLGREADAIGAAYWQSSTLTIDQIADEIKRSTEFAVRSAYQVLLGRKADESGLEYWMSSGLSKAQIFNAIKESPEAKGLRGFASGGYYPGGMALVGEAGPELINFDNGGMVYNAPQTSKMLNGGAEVASEVKNLREENREQSRAMVQLQARMTRLLERWDGDGIPEERVVTV